jgi:nucleotide-binding universal stress UspA family protein
MAHAFQKIALALAFSPTANHMIGIGSTMATIFNAQLILIHIGKHGEEENRLMNELIKRTSLPPEKVKVIWEEGKASEKILKVCKEEKIDLLVAGALKKENLVKYYMGTIARKIMRKAECSVLMIHNPSENSMQLKNIVVNAEDSPCIQDAIEYGCLLGQKSNASWVHIVRELKLYGLTMAASQHHSEKEYDEVRQKLVREEIEKVEEMLHHVPGEKPKVNIKIVSGKSGFELSKFAERKHADLLVVGAPPRRGSFFDRIFPHDLEYVFGDMPCNLLVVNTSRKGAQRG